MEVFISRDGESLGPYSQEELKKLSKNGELQEGDFAWKEGMEEWIPAADFLAREQNSDDDAGDVPLPKPISFKKQEEALKESAPAPVNPPSAPSPVSPPAPAPSIVDSPPPRSAKLRPPGTVLPDPSPAPTPAEKKPASSPAPSSSKPSISSMPTPDEIVRESGMVKPPGVSSAPPKVHVRKKPAKEMRVSYFRLLGLPLVAVMFYSLFIPFVRLVDNNDELVEKYTAASLALQSEGSTELMGIEQGKGIPQWGRLMMVCSLLGSLCLSLFLLRSALKPLGVISSNGVILCLAVIAVTSLLGNIYGVQLEKSAVEGFEGYQVNMEVGYYLALAVGVVGLALVVAPDYCVSKQLVPLFIPVVLILGIAGFTIWYGMNSTGSRFPVLNDAVNSVNLFVEELQSM